MGIILNRNYIKKVVDNCGIVGHEDEAIPNTINCNKYRISMINTQDRYIVYLLTLLHLYHLRNDCFVYVCTLKNKL